MSLANVEDCTEHIMYFSHLVFYQHYEKKLTAVHSFKSSSPLNYASFTAKKVYWPQVGWYCTVSAMSVL